MAKAKLTDAEEKKIAEQLKQFLHPTTLPDVIKKALLEEKIFPDEYEIYFPAGDIDDKEHLLHIDKALDAFSKGDMDDTDKKVIERLLAVPKIAHRIDYKYRGLLTRLKNSMIEGMDNEEEQTTKRSKKPENVDIFGNTVKPMKGFNAKPIVRDADGNEIENYITETIKPFNKHGGVWKDDFSNEKPSTNTANGSGKADGGNNKENNTGERKADRKTKQYDIDFGEEEDY